MTAPASLAPGTTIGGEYRIVRPLSEGGMGAVYVVEQPSTGKLRALKVMHPALVMSPDLRARFELEARVSGSIRSDHVVQVLAAGVDEPTGLPWLTMELLEGEDLAHALARGPMPPPQVHGVFLQLCHALAAAHAAGVVHRDLKPENLFLAVSRRADSPYTVKVLDFGIAKVVAEAQTVNTGAAGTPLYMSPEQTSAGSAISPSTDVWALGLIAFRMLTGRCYWRGGNADGATPLMILRETLMEPLVPASARAAELGVAALVPPGFDPWFARCVVREPGARFAHAGEAFRALAAALGQAPASLSDAPRAPSTPPSLDGPDSAFRTPPGVASPDQELPAPTVDGPRRSLVPVTTALSLALAAVVAVVALSRSEERATSEGASAPTAGVECPRDMALIHAGSFTLGETGRAASVHAFCMDLGEVTAKSFAACVDRAVCSAEGVDCSPLGTYGKSGQEAHPMNCVTWEQASRHCQARGARLPTEEEWEWAARGGPGAASYPWGNDDPAEQLCWSGVHVRDQTCAVGSFPAGDTRERVRDLAGNVVEWTASRYDTETDARVYRGGSYADLDRAVVRAAARHRASPTKRGERLGFRCAVDPTGVRSDVGAPF